MIKEYYLIKNIKTIGSKHNLIVVDKVPASGLREAENDFKVRNNFKRLLEKGDLTIVKSEKFYQ